jgi:hypothetical protein
MTGRIPEVPDRGEPVGDVGGDVDDNACGTGDDGRRIESKVGSEGEEYEWALESEDSEEERPRDRLRVVLSSLLSLTISSALLEAFSFSLRPVPTPIRRARSYQLPVSSSRGDEEAAIFILPSMLRFSSSIFSASSFFLRALSLMMDINGFAHLSSSGRLCSRENGRRLALSKGRSPER